MKCAIIDDEKSAVEYIQMILDGWESWQTHHTALVQALKILVSAYKLLTEENERLRDKLERTDRALIVMDKAHNKLFTESFKIKSDTVREMQERLIAEFRKDNRMNYYIRMTLDQIAKEMLEGTK